MKEKSRKVNIRWVSESLYGWLPTIGIGGSLKETILTWGLGKPYSEIGLNIPLMAAKSIQ